MYFLKNVLCISIYSLFICYGNQTLASSSFPYLYNRMIEFLYCPALNGV